MQKAQCSSTYLDDFSPNGSNGRQIHKKLEQINIFSINNHETGLKIQLKSNKKSTNIHTEIVRFMTKSRELVSLVAAPVKG